MTVAIWWIRRDLRLYDNAALTAAAQRHEHVIPVYVLDRRLLDSSHGSQRRTAFLFEGLRVLAGDIGVLGGELLVRSGMPEAVLADVSRQTGAVAIYAERGYSPYATKRDARVAAALPLDLVDGVTALPVGSVLKSDGSPYSVFTPFGRKWKQLWSERDPEPNALPERLARIPGSERTPIPAAPPGSWPGLPAPGESQARSVLAQFAEHDGAIYRYGVERELPGRDFTSRLSAHLRFGMISAAEAVRAARRAIAHATTEAGRDSAAAWLNELIWREFYINILYHFPYARERSLRPEYDRIAWLNDVDTFDAWREGRTGYPFVDAGMRQLAETGWMHNRPRMITAAFLVKDLLVDWRWGERWFMNNLIDGDPASNGGGWQWVAGTGTDAAPYFRVFNPVAQSRRHDPNGDYIRRWVPELRDVPGDFLHTPWQMPISLQQRCGCVVGRDYPRPIVDHGLARERAIAAYRAARTVD